jgi:nitrite reductase (NADH) large subunit
MTRYVIVGNGVAGATAAEEIAKRDPGGSVTILTDEDQPFYYRMRLPELLAGDVDESGLLGKGLDWHRERGMDLRLRTRAVSADPEARTVSTDSGEEVPFDLLLLANGGHSFVPPIEGAATPGAFTLRTMQDARDIRAWARNARRAVLIGGGLLGLEAGNGLRRLGMEVTVVEFFPRLLPRQLDPRGAQRLRAMMEGMGFSFRLGATTTRISGENRVETVHLADGETLPADMVLVSAGVRPNLDLARRLGVEVDKGVKVDERMRTSRRDVFAAGDVVEFRGRVYGIWNAAMEQGRTAGRNMAGLEETYQGTVMANRLKVAGIDLASAGEIDAQERLDSRIRETEGAYRKLVLAQGRIIGCIMLGDTAGFQEVSRLMQKEADVAGRVDQLLAGG